MKDRKRENFLNNEGGKFDAVFINLFINIFIVYKSKNYLSRIE